jgi:hypothetical protein
MDFHMSNYNNLTEMENSAIEYCSNNDKFLIHIFDIPSKGYKTTSVLFNELSSKNIPFSVKIEKNKQSLILYQTYSNDKNEESNKKTLQHLKESYGLKQIEKSDRFFIPNIKKIERENDNILKLKFSNNQETNIFVCILTEVNSEKYLFQRNFTSFLKDLVQADIFSIIISHTPSYEKNKGFTPFWGLVFMAENEKFDDLRKNKQNFLRYISASSTKLNSKLKVVSKHELNRNQINFRFGVPWIKHKGFFFDIIDIAQLLIFEKEKKEEITLAQQKKEKLKQISSQYQTVKQTNSISLYKPFPSVKTLKTESVISANKLNKEQLETEIKNNEIAPSNIDDMSVPVPRTMNAVFDSEYLKVRMSKIFKNLEFKETVIFEDSFDLVLRKGSSYIFIKLFQDALTQSQANEIVDALSSIAGLRNQFICIVVADVVEESSKKVLNEYNILHLTLQDLLLEEVLKSKIYNTILA